MALALRRRGEQEPGMWVATTSSPRSAWHPFYSRMNALLAEAKFDEFAEAQCAPYYAERLGRPSISPGVYVGANARRDVTSHEDDPGSSHEHDPGSRDRVSS